MTDLFNPYLPDREELVLRPDQQEVKNQVYNQIRSGNTKTVVQAMTSFGKTALASSIIQDALSKGVKVLFTAPMITLVEQTWEEFNRFGINDVGIIQADHPYTDMSQPVQVCSIQSIEALMKKDMEGWRRYQKGRLVIHDETHIFHKTHMLMNELADKPVIGLSATPWRKGLADYYDSLVNGPDTRWLIDEGLLSDYVAYSHHVPDMKGVAVNPNGDYALAASGEKYTPKVIGDIVGTWEKHAKGLKTILFAPRVADAERFADEFNRHGYRAIAVSGYMDQDDCADEVAKFKKGHYDIICSVTKLATGFNVRDVGCIIDAQPTQSLMRHIQKLGRGLRTHDDKDILVILDNAGNLLRNGMPDDVYPQELLGGNAPTSKDRRDPADPLPKVCPKCQTVKTTHVCPNCGFAPEKQSSLEVEAGELVELNAKDAKKANRTTTWEDKIQFIGELKGYASDKGYKPGWVARQYREKMGVWPNDERVRHAPAIKAGAMAKGWIQHQNIKRGRA